MAWFKQEEGGDRWQRIVDKSNGPIGANGYSLIADPVNRALYVLVDGKSYRSEFSVFEFDKWTHVAAVIDADDFIIYVNGVKQAGKFFRGSAELPPDVETEMRLGSWDHAVGRAFKGFIG